MTRRVYMLVLIGLVLGFSALRSTAVIVVLTETPVEEFILPDGTVLTNAYSWRRTSEGMMIVHDHGQFYLNFKTLPNDWREAYGVLDEIEHVKPTAAKRFDQYNVYPVLERIAGLSSAAVTYFESERYAGDVDELLISACALQYVLDGRTDKATRLHEILEKNFPDYEAIALDTFFTPCKECHASGAIAHRCNVCKGSGKCVRCNGTGETPSHFENSSATTCTGCRGTGKCTKCKGVGILSLSCPQCKGTGKILQMDELKSTLAELVQKLNKSHLDHAK